MDIATEEKIKQAAIEVFAKKGYGDTKTRDIASAASVNIASLHYHFKNKDELFKLVTNEVFLEFDTIMKSVVSQELSFKEKIYKLVAEITDYFLDKPYLAGLIIVEPERHFDKIYDNKVHFAMDQKLAQELRMLIDQGVVREISYVDFILSVSSLTVFPFVNKLMLHRVNGLTEHDFKVLMENRKKTVPEMVINYIYLK